MIKRIEPKIKCYIINDYKLLEDALAQIKANNAN